MGAHRQIRRRLNSLERHLKNENTLLVDAVNGFRRLDRVAYKMGLLAKDQSYAMKIAWWPMVSVLGTFSSGKSSFINHYLGIPLQATGTQAVDDKFTVVCYSNDEEARTLPGIALDADPRFPFYQMSEELEKVASGEGGRIDAYLQLKTCHSDKIRGNILIDSPGFDADAQRTATLRITDHIMDLSDLVLVFFDARHPEPGAMQDTLTHLVGNTIGRKDSSKFLYILNQIDSAAREDNPEDVVAAWQRAIAQEGLTAGKFYSIYSPDVEITTGDENLRQRFENKRDADLSAIHNRIQQVSVERAYRIIDALEKTAREIEEEKLPQLRKYLQQWGKGVFWWDVVLFGLLAGALAGGSIWAGYWQGLTFTAPWWEAMTANIRHVLVAGTACFFGGLLVHYYARSLAAGRVLKRIRRDLPHEPTQENMLRAFCKNTRPWRSSLSPDPAGWGRRARRQLHAVIADADRHVQKLNDKFADPSGES